MRLATFNVNGIRARLPRLLEWLEREKPDVVCLQELKCADESLPIADIEAAGYGAVWHGQKGFNGVAILAPRRHARTAPVGLPGDPDDTHSRYIEAEVGGVVVASLYLPNGNPDRDREVRLQAQVDGAARQRTPGELLADRAAGRAGRRLERGSRRSRRLLGPGHGARRACFSRRRAPQWRQSSTQGWTDALRALHPDDDKLYTFWDYTAGCWQRDAGFRIDHLLCSPEASDRLRGAGVDSWARDQEKASDHAPTWIELAD